MTLLDADRLQKLERFGEDSQDLLAELQASFGIEFTTDDLLRAETIGELGACIWEKLKRPASEQCLSALVFYRLRRALGDLFNIPVFLVKPTTPLQVLMPWIDRRNRWREVQAHFGWVLPALGWPAWLLCSSFVLAGAISALVAHRWPQVMTIPGIGLTIGVVLIWVLVGKLMSPLARSFPQSCGTLGDLVKLTLASNFSTIAARYGGASEREVFLVLRQQIAAAVAMDVERITPATRFPEGLNIC